MTSTKEANLAAALALADAGVKIFPAGADKRPLFKSWQQIATTDAAQVGEWWARAPHALPAIPCGVNNVVVIDLDRHPGAVDGVLAFKDLVARHGSLPRGVPMVRTPTGGGLHLYFHQPDGEPLGNGRGELPAGIDVRGTGGFVIAPGATLPDGRRWEEVTGRPSVLAFFKNGATPIPRWVQDIIRHRMEDDADHTDDDTNNTTDDAATSDTSNNATNTTDDTDDQRGRTYALAALLEIEGELDGTAAGQRNERLYKGAFRLGTMRARGWLADCDITVALTRASEANNYLREHGINATRKTIESGLRDGEKVPHPDLEDRAEYQARHERNEKPGGGGREQKDPAGRPDQRRQRQHRDTGSWDEPDSSILDDRRGDLPDLSTDVFPASLHRWLEDAARGAGVTIDHITTPLIGMASSQIGMARRVQATRSWLQPMTCWASLVGVNGSGKTPAFDTVKRVLSFIERNRTSEIAALQLAHETRVEAAKVALKKWKEEVAQAIEAEQPPPAKPAETLEVAPFVAPRLYVSDATIERIAPLLQARPHGMLYVADELARLFLNMQRYSNGSDREFWLEAWDGKSFVVERQGRPPIIVPHLLVGVVGGFQPDKLVRSFEGDADGLYARFLYCWPREPAYRAPAQDVAEIEPEIVNAFHRLLGLSVVADGVFVPRDSPLAEPAWGSFLHFLQFLHEGKAELDGREREYFCKGSAHVLRLAGTLAYLDWSFVGGAEPHAIAARHLDGAVALWRDYYWPHACAALRQMGISDRHADARQVLRWIRANQRVEVAREDLRREALKRRLDADQTQAVIDGLVKAGWLKERTIATPGRHGRRWDVNPRLFS